MMEVMIASGLMGVAALGMMQLQKSSSEGQNRARTSMEIFSLQQNLKQRFLNAEICLGTLNNAGIDYSTATITGYADQIASPSVEPPASVVGKNFANIIRQKFKPDGSLDGTVTITSVGTKYNGERIELKEMHVFDLKSVGSAVGNLQKHEVVLRVGYLRKKHMQQDDIEGSMIYSFINLQAMVAMAATPINYDWAAKGQVVKCFSAEGNAVETAMKLSCLSIDFDGDGLPDNKFDDNTLVCSPATGNEYCLFGGTFTGGTVGAGTYNNVVTGGQACPATFTKVKTGHLTQARPRACGKLQCYNFYKQPVYTCLKCVGNNASSNVDAYGNVSNAAADADACDPPEPTCGPMEYPKDTDNDGCDNICVPIPFGGGGGGGMMP